MPEYPTIYITLGLLVEKQKVLPKHGWIGCNRCYSSEEQFRLIGASPPPAWKIEKPNGAWGAIEPLVIVLGFSRGARQSKPLPFDEVAFSGMREQLTKIMKALDLLGPADHVSNHIRVDETDFHFGSLLRCSVSMWDKKKNSYSKSGNSILEKCLASSDTRVVAHNCTEQFLSALPARTKLILLLGNSEDYIEGCKSLFKRIYPDIRPLNDVAYSNGRLTCVHSIHAAALGDYVPQWLRGANSAIGSKLKPARDAVASSGVLSMLQARRAP